MCQLCTWHTCDFSDPRTYTLTGQCSWQHQLEKPIVDLSRHTSLCWQACSARVSLNACAVQQGACLFKCKAACSAAQSAATNASSATSSIVQSSIFIKSILVCNCDRRYADFELAYYGTYVMMYLPASEYTVIPIAAGSWTSASWHGHSGQA